MKTIEAIERYALIKVASWELLDETTDGRHLYYIVDDEGKPYVAVVREHPGNAEVINVISIL